MTARLAAFGIAAAVCLTLYWPGLRIWFWMDDYAWLGLRLSIFDWHSFLDAVFSPKAQGTIRPLSERLYFLGLEWLFGVEALPFRIVAFATQLLNLWLILRLVEKLTGSRTAGAITAVVWIVNGALVRAMTWSSAYNQILWPCFLLAACHMRWKWLTKEDRRARRWEWVFFLGGFGALELMVIYPALAAGLTLLYRRERWREILPLSTSALAYLVWNRMTVRAAGGSVYQLYWDTGILSTLGVYLRMAGGLWQPGRARPEETWWLAAEVLTCGAVAIAAAVLLFRRERLAAFGLLWFLAAIGPVLPLKNHISPYYTGVPALGIAMIAGIAAVRWPRWMAVPLLVSVCGSAWWTRQEVDYNYHHAYRSRVMFRGVREAAARHPGKTILLTGIENNDYWYGWNDDPFRLLPGVQVYLAPGGADSIARQPEIGDPERFLLPPVAARKALESGRAMVYAHDGSRLRNVTRIWTLMAREQWPGDLDAAIDVAVPAQASQLVSGWHEIEHIFRWSTTRPVLRLAAPGPAKELLIEAFRGDPPQDRGDIRVLVRLNGSESARLVLPAPDENLNATIRLPDGLDRGRSLLIELDIQPPVRKERSGPRELGLVFGRFRLR